MRQAVILPSVQVIFTPIKQLLHVETLLPSSRKNAIVGYFERTGRALLLEMENRFCGPNAAEVMPSLPNVPRKRLGQGTRDRPVAFFTQESGMKGSSTSSIVAIVVRFGQEPSAEDCQCIVTML
jgi:hypothetical protein